MRFKIQFKDEFMSYCGSYQIRSAIFQNGKENVPKITIIAANQEFFIILRLIEKIYIKNFQQKLN